MKKCFLLAAFAAITTIGSAQTYELSDGKSPNGLYAVSVENLSVKDGKPARINYRIANLKTHDTLLEIPSSYQTEGGGKPGWALDYAKDADIYWSKDSSRVAIDEECFRFRGTVFIAVIVAANKAIQIPLPEKEIAKETGMEWDRYRIRVRTSWNDNHELKLIWSGNVAGEKKGTYRNLIFFPVILAADDLTSKVKSVDITDTPQRTSAKEK